MDTTAQTHSSARDLAPLREAAARLREAALTTTLVVPNVWDGLSTALACRAGAPVIATTSAGIAWAAGKLDGGGLDREAAISAIAVIAAVSTVPVSADIEHGYGESVPELTDTIRRVVFAGAVGINLEDSLSRALRPTAEQAARITVARTAAIDLDVPVWINARIDTFVCGAENPVAETIERAQAYVAAGADSIFVPGASEVADIAELAAAIPVPLNVLATPGVHTVPQLEQLGVRRVSIGDSGTLAAYGLFERVATELLGTGELSTAISELTYGGTNALLRR